MARRIVAADASDRPRYRTFPSRTSSAIAPTVSSIGASHVAELGGEHDPIAPAPDRAPQQYFVLEGAVHVRRVEERDAEVDRPLDRGDGLGLVRRPVEFGHSHATQPDGRYLKPLFPKPSRLHGEPPVQDTSLPREGKNKTLLLTPTHGYSVPAVA